MSGHQSLKKEGSAAQENILLHRLHQSKYKWKVGLRHFRQARRDGSHPKNAQILPIMMILSIKEFISLSHLLLNEINLVKPQLMC